ncbi:hypothetical protein N431DRAFT_446776 [Stipitochalara longipes BDJ]|nr:hypothetical protein N431DRAFT_446776 [Stipitochalara longipes BDJ]
MADPNQPAGAQNMPWENVENHPSEGKLKKPPKKGILPGIWSDKDGPGPAKWRCDNTAIRGQVRRKGERDPMNGGLRMTKAMANLPRYREAGPLPPLSPEAQERIEKLKAAKAEKERERQKKKREKEKKKGGVGGKKKEKKGKKDDGCELM